MFAGLIEKFNLTKSNFCDLLITDINVDESWLLTHLEAINFL